jgi:hypothetical protein
MTVLEKLTELGDEADKYNGCLTAWYRAAKIELGTRSFQAFRNYFKSQKITDNHTKIALIGAKVIKEYRRKDAATIEAIEAILQ